MTQRERDTELSDDGGMSPERGAAGISGRSVALGLLFIVANAWWVTMVEVRYYMLDGSSLPLFITPVFLLFVLVIANAVVGRFSRITPLRQSEMGTVYIMTVLSTVFASHDLLQNFFGFVTHPYQFTGTEAGWQETFLRFIPPQLFVTDPEALKTWYRGNIGPAQAIGFLPHWVLPLALWGVFFLVLVFLFLCATILFRRAWTENERLAFPIVQLPLAMTEPGGKLYRERLMWFGFTIAFSVGLLNGIHELYPQVPNWPYIKLFNVGQFLTVQPWEAIRAHGMHTSLYPFAIGLAYFIPLDLAFSCWFSYLLSRGYFVLGRTMAWDTPSAGQGWPFVKELSSGAWLGLAAAILWSNRRHLSRAFRASFPRFGHPARPSDPEDTEDVVDPAEARRYRFAFIGLIVGSLFLLVWSHFLGIHPLVALGFFTVLFGLSLAITRVRAEFGVPHEIFFVKPAEVMVSLFGARALGESNIIGMQTMYWFNRGYRSNPMPNLLEAFKIGEETAGPRFRFGQFVAVLVLACVASLLATYAANYFITYDAGAKSKAIGYKWWIGQESLGPVSNWISLSQPTSSKSFYFLAAGLGAVGTLAYLRSAFLWWPLHPAGFALGISYAMNYFWFCLLVAWLAKLFIIRYGGMSAHKRAIPFFLGLILGDYTIGALWSLLALVLGVPTYRIYI